MDLKKRKIAQALDDLAGFAFVGLIKGLALSVWLFRVGGVGLRGRGFRVCRLTTYKGLATFNLCLLLLRRFRV